MSVTDADREAALTAFRGLGEQLMGTLALPGQSVAEQMNALSVEAIATAIAQARVDAERDTAKRISEEADKRMASLQSEVATTRLHWKEAAKLLATDEAASLGFSANQAAAVATLLRDRDALAAQVEALTKVLEQVGEKWEQHGGGMGFVAFWRDAVDAALAATPAASLIAHDNALIERCAARIHGWISADVRGVTSDAMAEYLRALKTDSEGSTT